MLCCIDHIVKNKTDFGQEIGERERESELECDEVNVEEQENMKDISSLYDVVL